MSDNVGGKFTIKLANGKSVNLNKLDELLNKSIAGSVFAGYDGKYGGIKNNIFDQAEVDAIKEHIIQAHENGSLSQADLDKFLGSVDNLQSDVEPQNQPESRENTEEQPNSNKTQQQDLTNYVIQPGDSPKLIAEKLGLKGEEARRAIAHLSMQLNNKGWFSVGQNVTIPGDHNAKIEKMRKDPSTYSEDIHVLRARAAEATQSTVTKSTPTPATTSTKKPATPTVPTEVTNMVNKIRSAGGTAKLITNGDGTYTISYSGDSFCKTNKLTKVELKYDSKGNRIEQKNYYPNGDTRVAKVTGKSPNYKYTWEATKKYDTTPSKNRAYYKDINPKAKKGADEIKEELQAFWTSNSTARNLLKKHMTNVNAAYVILNYTNLVKNIDHVIGLDIEDIKKYVLKPLNARLNELGQNKLALKESDLKGKNITQVQTLINNLAKKIRDIDSANGYIYVPDSKNSGLLAKPKRADQMANYIGPKPKAKTTAKPKTTSKPKTNTNTKPKAKASTTPINPQLLATFDTPSLTGKPKKVELVGEELKYPKDVQDYILSKRAQGYEYTVTIVGSEIRLNLNLLTSSAQMYSKGKKQTTFSLDPSKLDDQNPEWMKVFKYKDPVYVTQKFEELSKLTGNKGVEVKKSRKGVYTITQTAGIDKNKKVSRIEYVYNSDGTFQYQLEYSSENASIKIGRKEKGKIKYTQYKDANGNLTNENLSSKLKQRWREIHIEDPTATFTRGKTYYTITQHKGAYLTQNNLTKVVYKYDGLGNLVAQDNTYTNGRTLNYYDINNTKNDGAHTANPISINLPQQYLGSDANGTSQMIYGLTTSGPKETAQKFANGITNNKATLMASLHLTNEEYDNLAIIAMGIAEQETHFGQNEYQDTSGNKHRQDRLVGFDGFSPTSDRAYRKKFANNWVWSVSEQMEHSQGITQIRFKDALNDKDTKNLFIKHGLLLARKSGEDEKAWYERSFKAFLASPEKQAVATMILLKQRKNIAEGSEWQQRLLKNNKQVSNPEDRLTTNDIIAMSWNGLGGLKTRLESGEVMTINSTKKTVITGYKRTVYSPTTGLPAYQVDETKELNGCFYAFAVRKYANHFFADPRQADSGSIHLTTSANQAGANMATGQDNGGMLGEVIFKPNSYTNKGRVISSQSTAAMHALIDANTKLSDANKQLLKDFITNKQISFGTQGLKEAEAMSITNEDVQRMKSILAQIDAGTLTPNQANEKFETAQIEARQFTVSKNSVPASSILTLITSSTPRDMRLLPDLSFDINKGFYTGIKRNTASPVSFGASSYQNTFAVTTSKGVNPYLSNGTLARNVDRVAAEHAHYTANTLFNSGGHCKNGISVDLEYSLGIDHTKIRGIGGRSIGSAKELVEFYNAHPEVFDHIKWVDMGNGQARELNSTDVANLPCGYYGVFSPGEGKSLDESVNYDEQHGHAFVSDGFGEANADEHDNGKWTHFTNGKGEHGKLDVYRLNNRVVAVYSEKLGRTVNVPLDINPWYLKPEWRELQTAERKKQGLAPLEVKEEFPI